MARYDKHAVFCLVFIIFLDFVGSQLLGGLVFTLKGDSCYDVLGRKGNCVPIQNCRSALDELKSGGRPRTCGFAGYNPKVCCPSIPPTTTAAPYAKKPGETAEFWCAQYQKVCPVFLPIIVGGTRVLPEEFPHMVRAAIGYGPENNIQWSCGGSLISEKFVLTAAHCLHSGKKPAQWVLLGSEILRGIGETIYDQRSQIHSVVQRVRHPEYKPPSKYNDLALLEIGPSLEQNVLPTLSRSVHPACLPTSTQFYQINNAIATGWGRVGFGEDGSPDLLKVDLDIIDPFRCNKTYEVEIRSTKYLMRGIDHTMLCAGVLAGGKDTCQGDSGGPLQVKKLGSCLYNILGVTSFGKLCAFENSPSVYTRVSEFVPWIESIVWPTDA